MANTGRPSEHRTEPVHLDDVESGATGAQTGLERVLEGWPKEPRASARRIMKEYGPPDEHSYSQLIWHKTSDGWKRTVLSRERIPHEFLACHTDFLEQFIDYRVPVEMFTDLAEFDRSLIAERTKGEMSACCGGTSMNFVAIQSRARHRDRQADRTGGAR